jgi:uncharacterized membrane protein (UPF0127 family)
MRVSSFFSRFRFTPLVRGTPIVVFCVLCFFLVGCSKAMNPEVVITFPKTTITLTSPDKKVINIPAEMATTSQQHQRGLMFREKLDAKAGMLFVFEQLQPLNFWMKNTKIPLDIIFFDKNGDFVNALTMEPCTAAPCPTYKAAALSSYALEVNKDYRTTHKIGTGWKIDPKAVKKISNPS